MKLVKSETTKQSPFWGVAKNSFHDGAIYSLNFCGPDYFLSLFAPSLCRGSAFELGPVILYYISWTAVEIFENICNGVPLRTCYSRLNCYYYYYYYYCNIIIHQNKINYFYQKKSLRPFTMSLPAALQARLAKRGLIKSKENGMNLKFTKDISHIL